MYRWFATNAKEAKEPEAVLTLARYLGRRKRTREALDVCELAWENCPAVAVAEASVAVLHDGQPDEEQFQRVERRLGRRWRRRRTARNSSSAWRASKNSAAPTMFAPTMSRKAFTAKC